MKKNEVPQDDENLLEGKFGKVNYALDDQGNYIQVTSKGWEPENIALKQAWQEIMIILDIDLSSFYNLF